MEFKKYSKFFVTCVGIDSREDLSMLTYINPAQIISVRKSNHSEAVITLTDGNTYNTKESANEVMDKILAVIKPSAKLS